MKKFLPVVFIVLLIPASIKAILAYVERPSTLELTISLTEGGEDISSKLQHYVGYVRDGQSGLPNLGNLRQIKPLEGTSNVYEVPSNHRIGIFVITAGAPPFQSIVRVEPRQHLKHNFVLNAGTVRVSTETNGADDHSPVRYVDPNGVIEDRPSKESGFLVPAGVQVFQAGRFLESKRESLEVVAGHTHELKISRQIGSLSLNFETALPYEKWWPTPVIRSNDGGNILHFQGTDFDAGRWQYGSYNAVLDFSEGCCIPSRQPETGNVTVIIDQPENTMTIPLSVIAVEAFFNDWAEGPPSYATAVVVSVSDPGLPFTTSRMFREHAALMFLPPEGDHEYALGLIDNRQVLALQPLGYLSADERHQVSIGQGGDLDLCEAILAEFDCSLLAQNTAPE